MTMEYTEKETELLHLLPLLYRLICLTEAHKKFGITKSQMIIFIVLYYREGVTMSEIARYISSSKEQATRAVASLCDNGLVERCEDAANRTRVLIRFTEDGRNYMRQLVSWLRTDISQKLSASLSTDDLQRLHQSVQTTVEILGKVK